MAEHPRPIQAILPIELLIYISEYLTIPDLNALARTDKYFYELLNTRLYRRDAISNDSSALIWAATYDKKPTASRSISAGAKIQNFTDKDPRIKGCTPLALAAYHGSISVLKVLLALDEAYPNSRDRKYFRPPLSWAAREGHSQVVRALLNDPRVDVDLSDKWHDTPLIIAVDHHPELVPLLLQRGHADPRIRNCHGATPLSVAAVHDVEETDLLLAAHVQLILAGDDGAQHCQHVFFYAAITGSVDVVKYMVEYFGEKLDPNGARGAHGRGAFSIAAERNRVDVVRYLCGWGKTNPNLSDSWEHDTPLFSAAKHGRKEIVQVLLECERVDLELPNVRGTTPLGIAAATNHHDIVELLLAGPRRANPNALDENCHTPLYLAALFGNIQAVEALLKAEGIEPMRGDESEGTTPLDIAVERGHHELAERLRQCLDGE